MAQHYQSACASTLFDQCAAGGKVILAHTIMTRSFSAWNTNLSGKPCDRASSHTVTMRLHCTIRIHLVKCTVVEAMTHIRVEHTGLLCTRVNVGDSSLKITVLVNSSIKTYTP